MSLSVFMFLMKWYKHICVHWELNWGFCWIALYCLIIGIDTDFRIYSLLQPYLVLWIRLYDTPCVFLESQFTERSDMPFVTQMLLILQAKHIKSCNSQPHFTWISECAEHRRKQNCACFNAFIILTSLSLIVRKTWAKYREEDRQNTYRFWGQGYSEMPMLKSMLIKHLP